MPTGLRNPPYRQAGNLTIANVLTRKKAGDTHPVRTPGLRDMSLLAKPKGLLKTVIPNKENGDRSLAVFSLMAGIQWVKQPSFVI